MTVSFTPSWKSLASALTLAGCLFAGFVAPAHADGAVVRSAELVANDDWYALHAEFDVTLTRALEEALSNGISLNFLVEFELTRPRWYWLDESIASVRQNVHIGYQPLTGQYQFASDGGNKSFTSLPQVKDELNRLSHWRVVDRALLKKGAAYQGAVRIKLDPKQLPRPLQVQALGSSDWAIASDWFRFNIAP